MPSVCIGASGGGSGNVGLAQEIAAQEIARAAKPAAMDQRRGAASFRPCATRGIVQRCSTFHAGIGLVKTLVKSTFDGQLRCQVASTT
jgi:hypothetical protein